MKEVAEHVGKAGADVMMEKCLVRRPTLREAPLRPIFVLRIFKFGV